MGIGVLSSLATAAVAAPVLARVIGPSVNGVAGHSLQYSVLEQFAPQRPGRVDCPRGRLGTGETTTCILSARGHTITLHVTERGAPGGADLDIEAPPLLHTDAVIEVLSNDVSDFLGYRAQIDCGRARVRLGFKGDRFQCTIAVHGQRLSDLLTVTVSNATGGFYFNLPQKDLAEAAPQGQEAATPTPPPATTPDQSSLPSDTTSGIPASPPDTAGLASPPQTTPGDASTLIISGSGGQTDNASTPPAPANENPSSTPGDGTRTITGSPGGQPEPNSSPAPAPSRPSNAQPAQPQPASQPTSSASPPPSSSTQPAPTSSGTGGSSSGAPQPQPSNDSVGTPPGEASGPTIEPGTEMTSPPSSPSSRGKSPGGQPSGGQSSG